MKTLILFFALLITLQTHAQKFKITRYEQKSNELFICVNSKKNPQIFVEKFLTEAERKDSITIRGAIETMVAELQIKEAEHVEQEKAVSKPKKAERLEMQADTTRIRKKKFEILEGRIAFRDSTAKAESAKLQPTFDRRPYINP